jgi:hypothetical protein
VTGEGGGSDYRTEMAELMWNNYGRAGAGMARAYAMLFPDDSLARRDYLAVANMLEERWTKLSSDKME